MDPPDRTADPARVDAALGAVAHVAGSLGLDPHGPRTVIRVASAVLLADPDAAVLVRVDDRAPADRARRQVAAATALAAAGVPAIRLAGTADQPVTAPGGTTVSVWHLEDLTGTPVTPVELGAVAHHLHTATAGGAHCAGVAAFDPFTAIAEQLAVARAAAVIDPAALDLLDGIGQALATAWPGAVADAPTALVHGDLHAGNVLATTRGPVLADLELAGIGPAAYDLAAAVVAVERYGAPRSHLAGFTRGYGCAPPDASTHGVLRDTYELWLTAWAVANAGTDATHLAEAHHRLDRWHHPDRDRRWTLL